MTKCKCKCNVTCVSPSRHSLPTHKHHSPIEALISLQNTHTHTHTHTHLGFRFLCFILSGLCIPKALLCHNHHAVIERLSFRALSVFHSGKTIQLQCFWERQS